jgi:hypothetical protein
VARVAYALRWVASFKSCILTHVPFVDLEDTFTPEYSSLGINKIKFSLMKRPEKILLRY